MVYSIGRQNWVIAGFKPELGIGMLIFLTLKRFIVSTMLFIVSYLILCAYINYLFLIIKKEKRKSKRGLLQEQRCWLSPDQTPQIGGWSLFFLRASPPLVGLPLLQKLYSKSNGHLICILTSHLPNAEIARRFLLQAAERLIADWRRHSAFHQKRLLIYEYIFLSHCWSLNAYSKHLLAALMAFQEMKVNEKAKLCYIGYMYAKCALVQSKPQFYYR